MPPPAIELEVGERTVRVSNPEGAIAGLAYLLALIGLRLRS